MSKMKDFRDEKYSDGMIESLLDKDAFARHVMGVARDAIGDPEPSYDPDEFQVRLPNGGAFYLGNVHREYALMDRSGRASWLSSLTKMVTELARFSDVPVRYDDVVGRLYPVVASRSGVETDRLCRGTDALPPYPFGVVSEHVAYGLVVDMPHTFAHVRDGDLRQWGVSFEAASEAATRNLRATNRKLWRQARRGLYVAEGSWDDYTASALLLPDLFDGLDVRGDLVVLAPWRGVLMATGSREIEGLKHMACLARNLIDHPRSIWPAPLVLKGGKWLPFIPDCDPDIRTAFQLLKATAVTREYDRQASVLGQAPREGAPMPHWSEFDQSTGELASLTLWPKQSSPVLLPKADIVAIMDMDVLTGQPAQPVVRVRWDRLASTLRNGLRKLPQYFPARYLAVAFPSDEEMMRLRAATVTTGTDHGQE